MIMINTDGLGLYQPRFLSTWFQFRPGGFTGPMAVTSTYNILCISYIPGTGALPDVCVWRPRASADISGRAQVPGYN